MQELEQYLNSPAKNFYVNELTVNKFAYQVCWKLNKAPKEDIFSK